MNATKRKPRAGIYVRLSREVEGQTSIERQTADCKALAKARGLTVGRDAIYADVGLSGYKNVARPEFERLTDDVRDGNVDVIVCWKLDRITRKGIRDIAPLLQLLDDTGAQLVAVQDAIDTSTPMGEAMLGLLASMAKQESLNISTRTRSAKALAAKRGARGGGGLRPFGYQKVLDAEGNPTSVLEVDAAEADLVREAAKRYRDGESLRAIAGDWNRRKITTPGGAPWTSANLGRTLRSPLLAGLRVHRHRDPDGQVVVDLHPGTWEPILPREDHDAIVAATTVLPARSVSAHLLTGFLFCTCGGRMRHKSTARFGRQYVCKRCEKVSIAAPTLERVVSEMVENLLDDPAIRSALATVEQAADLDALADAIDADRAALRDLSADYYTHQLISRDEFLANRGPITERIEATEAKLARLTAEAERTLDDDPAALWASGELERRREVLGVVLDRIVVSPTKVRGRSSFDPDRLAFTWKV